MLHEKITWKSKINFGRYAGTALDKLPKGYLIWLYTNGKAREFKSFIKHNVEGIKKPKVKKTEQNERLSAFRSMCPRLFYSAWGEEL